MGGQLELRQSWPPIVDEDRDGIKSLYVAVLQRAMHDACGATVVSPTPTMQLRFATEAWNFLYSNKSRYRNERWLVCEFAGICPEQLERRLTVAAIPHPTATSILRSWGNIESMYWRLAGSQGEPPVAKPVRTEPQPRRKIKSHIPKIVRRPLASPFFCMFKAPATRPIAVGVQ